jgi:hypothetical protein
VGAVWAAAEAEGERVVDARMVALSDKDARAVSADVAGGGVVTGSAIALSVAGEDSVEKARALAAHVASSGCRPAARPRRRCGLGRAAAA